MSLQRNARSSPRLKPTITNKKTDKNINKTVPGKNPAVYRDSFVTDKLTQSEAVALVRALAKIDELKALGKPVTIFRLFDGKAYECEESNVPIKKKMTIIKTTTVKGGRMK